MNENTDLHVILTDRHKSQIIRLVRLSFVSELYVSIDLHEILTDRHTSQIIRLVRLSL
jgi:hypothetical protein